MRKNIAVVDDQLGIRLLLNEVFTTRGYRVTTMETGKEAVKKVKQDSFDLLIIDYKMPLMNGIEVITALKEQHIFIPTILLSGLTDEVRSKTEKLTMIKGIFDKPFNINDLCSDVDCLLGIGVN